LNVFKSERAVLGARPEPRSAARTLALVAGVVPLVDKLGRISRVPVVRGAVSDLVALLDSLRG
jgi:hypothetical protein